MTSKWNNSWNWKYYERMPFKILKKWLKKKGLESNQDLISFNTKFFNNYCIENKIHNPDALEIGGGIGRVPEWFLKTYPTGSIKVIEVTKRYFDYLKAKFKNSKKIQVARISIQNYSSKKKYDVIFWLWAGILEMIPQERMKLLKKLKKKLKAKGILVIEMPERIIGEKKGTPLKAGYGKVSEKHGDLYFHLISENSFAKMIKKMGLDVIKHVEYKTKTKHKRSLYILKNK